jgi:hypothetical protein
MLARLKSGSQAQVVKDGLIIQVRGTVRSGTERKSHIQKRSPVILFRDEHHAGPTTVCFVFFIAAIVSSDKPRWAFTSSGGVNASHWIQCQSEQ